MNDLSIIFTIIAVAIIIAVILRRSQAPDLGLQTKVDALQNQIMVQMQGLQELIQSQLQEHRQTLASTNAHIGTRLDNAAHVVSKVHEKLAQLDEGSKRILEVGKDIASLQDILRAPKLRGTLGELFLGDMLAQTLPREHYQLQYSFKSGETVDAIVKLRDGLLVPIDAKFPLENMRRMLENSDKAEQDKWRKAFRLDVKKHIDAIANKYILPSEGTFDFALMYVPAENVYYETVLRDEGEGALISYAFQKRVIPVSPNTLYIYLQAILLGLRGLRIEEEAQNILIHLQTLGTEFGKFTKDYAVLGSHLQNAQSKYQDTERQIGKIGGRLDTIESGAPTDTKSLLQ